MVTALQDIENRIKAIEAGADDFLSKPVRPDARAGVAEVNARRAPKLMVFYASEERTHECN